jgi:hypothetical protein
VSDGELRENARRAAVLYWDNVFGTARWRRAERTLCHGDLTCARTLSVWVWFLADVRVDLPDCVMPVS